MCCRMSQKFHFITYGGGAPKYKACMDELLTQVKHSGVFNSITGYTDVDLRSMPEFWSKHGQFIERCQTEGKRGFGYWIWKPFLTMHELTKMNDNDILVYMDGGCMLNLRGIPRLQDYFRMVTTHESGSIGFKHNLEWTPRDPYRGLLEEEWTKADMFDKLVGTMPSSEIAKIAKTPQLIGGIFVIRKCAKTVNSVKSWYEACCDYTILADEPNVKTNKSCFREHRHDQSAWSIVRKLDGSLLLDNEVYFGPRWNSVRAINAPFWLFQKPHKVG